MTIWIPLIESKKKAFSNCIANMETGERAGRWETNDPPIESAC